MNERYLTVYEHRKEGYSGFVLGLPGCIATGEDLDAMQKNMRDTFAAHIAALNASGEEIPDAVTSIVHFPHPSEGHGIDHWVVEELGAGSTKLSGSRKAKARTKTKS